MTKAQLRRQLRLRIGNPTKDEVSDDQLDGFLQAALEALNRRAEVAWADITSITTESGTQEYALPANVVRVEWVEYGTTMLGESSQEELRARYSDFRNATAGTPTTYVIYDRKILLYPKPNGAQTLRIRAVVTPADIPDGGPTELATQDHRTLVLWAAAEYHASVGDPARAPVFFNLFNAEAKLINDQIEFRDTGSKRK